MKGKIERRSNPPDDGVEVVESYIERIRKDKVTEMMR